MFRSIAVALFILLSFPACGVDELGDFAEPGASSAPIPAASTDDLDPAAIVAATSQIQRLADSTDKRLRQVRALTLRERIRLRRDKNAAQIARARQLGVRNPGDLDAAVAADKLVKLADTTELWALHNLNYSVPYVTPSAYNMITEIARRFQQRLDSLHVPRYRVVITSAMRTPEKQAALRRINANASDVESAHEFGTTVDIAYRRFAPPIDAAPLPADTIERLADSVMVKTGSLRAAELQAVLGRVIAEMRQEGKLMVMMERSQTVYHVTVARRLPAHHPASP
ncbi:MAG TPA: DUF5715 family protein [Longimicrobiales bacterium]|nr:DUF5715 family protein [Longimicrobiales bacterium]